MGWKKGDVIVRADPYAHVLGQKHRGTRCDNCFTCGKVLKKCTACMFLYYCSRACQKKDWPLHKDECPCLKRVAPKIPTDSVRLLLRLLIRLQRGDGQKTEWDSANWRPFVELETHSREILQDENRSDLLAQATFTLRQMVGDSVSLPEAGELVDMFGRMVINTFSICDGEMQPIGSGVYLSPSLLDHSCVPNAVAVFIGTTLSVRCLTDIPSDQPTQVLISYIDQLAPSGERRKQLEEQYYFTCQCRRCTEADMDGLMLGAVCQQTSCDGTLLRDGTAFSACQSCQLVCSDEAYKSQVQTVMEESQTALKTLADLKKSGDPETRLRVCKELLRKQRVLSPFNVYRVKTLDQAMDACIDSQQWEHAVDFGQQTVQPYMKLHPPGSPTVGIQLLKLGKLQLYLHRLQAARTSLQQAESILRVTHGESHEVYQELSELLHRCVAEMEHSEG
ncbi:histone-lysine N-methyltransferase SMYD3-like [Haliotis rubra]|uniref:histone-lysine N-methyltransferase SMYD3-like n=1 Tax=Haliotis rubra TaxID=36100 RepID=UPI001EE5F22A|nr:histone-lysine N-methyltransferase SMYD3-like [Haliotis rubra]